MPDNRILVAGMDMASCNFEESRISGVAFEPLDPAEYPADQKKLVEEVNCRAALANERYHMALLREEMLDKGFDAGMYIARFDESEQMISFEFTDGTRRMLGYDGLEDLPNEFDSWVRTLVPEEKDVLVKLFWDSVKRHRELPDISHATYRMQKKDGSLIWVTGAGRFVRRKDGSLECYMGCYREVTAEHEKNEYLKIIEGVGRVFNFSIYIDMPSADYRIISTNEFVEKVEKCKNAFEFLRANVRGSVAADYHQELNHWLQPEIILAELENNPNSVRDFYSDAADAWFRGIFMVGDRDEDGNVTHLIYGCQNIDAQVRDELAKAEAARKQEEQLKALLKAREDDAIREILKLIVKEGDEALINSIMETVGAYYQADRCYIFEEDPTGQYIVNTYEWCAPGVAPEKDNLQVVPIEAVDPWLREFKKQGAFYLTCDDEYAQKEPIVYEVLKPQNIQSLMAAPMVDSGQEIGFLGVDNPRANTGHKLYLSIAATSAYHELRSIHEKEHTERAVRRINLIQKIVQAGQWAYEIDGSGNVTNARYDSILKERADFAEHSGPEDWLELIHPDDREETLSKFYAATHDFSGDMPYEATYRLLGRDGSYRWNKSSGRLFAHGDGTYDLLGSSLDIHDQIVEREQYQEQLKDALHMAENSNRAKSDFLQTMSHDIRTPMNGIIGMTAIAAAHIDDKERVQDSLTKITAASRHLLGLINEVLDMSKIESGKVSLTEEEFNLSDLVDNLVTMVRPQIAEHGHELTVNIQKVEHELVIGDPLHIQQAFVNLMSNAVKYTPDGGNINLNIREIPSGQAKVGCYEFVFKDNGIGMSEEYLDHIFEPFSRAEDGRVSKVQGTGLGMPITRNIVNMMGGDIKVESKINEGSTFTVTILLKLQDTEAENRAEFANLSVLVADDDEMSLESAVDILERLSMQAEGVLSGKAAVERVTARHEAKQDYNAVILDWKMPGMDGVETARAIRAEIGEDIPIIILSAYDWSDIEAEARAAGVNAFVSKPLFKSRLERIFDDLMGEKKEPENGNSPLQNLEKMDLSAYRCLLVEDNELNAEIAQEILEETGMKVEHVWDGAEAVEAVTAAEDGKYDLILMDIQMPKMNGYDATRAIRASQRKYCKTVPIIAMTANAFAEDVQAARTSGMNEHIAKPIDLKVLARIMDKWLVKKD